MIEAHLRRLRQRDTIDAEEEREIRSLISETRRIEANTTLIHRNEEIRHSVLLIDGWLGRTVDMQVGTRVITALHVPGDFADLHGFTLKRLDHDVVALTDCVVALAPHDRLTELTIEFAHLARVYWFSTNVDAAIHRQWTVSLGRRNALSRMAHLFCSCSFGSRSPAKLAGRALNFR